MVGKLQNLLKWVPLEAGKPATPLSLTADDGTWIKLPDFKGHLNVLLVFFKATNDDATLAYLKNLEKNRERFEQLETAVFGVHTAKTDALRAFRSEIGIQYFLLYDPMAFASRGFRASSRIRPRCKDTTVLVGKDGNVLFSQRGFADIEALLGLIARTDGKEVPDAAAHETGAGSAGGASDNLRTPGKGPADVREIDSETAMRMLSEKDSPYLLVDVRTKPEWDREHVPMARLIPVDELPHRYTELKQDNHLIFLCQGGGRSAAAAEFMTSIGGHEIYNVSGGMDQWTGPKVQGG